MKAQSGIESKITQHIRTHTQINNYICIIAYIHTYMYIYTHMYVFVVNA